MASSGGRWFHANINSTKSEELLLSKGVDGTFLVRNSQSKPGNFTISVIYNGEVTNIQVLNDGDWFQLVALDGAASEPFATLNDLVVHCMKSPTAIPLKDGGFIELKTPLVCDDPTSARWFHGPLKGSEAEKLLLSKGSIGSFLVRESQSQPGQYVLTVRTQSGISHIIIKNRNGKFDVGSGSQFDSLTKLVKFYRDDPQLRDANTHNVIRLGDPFHSTSFLARNIGERIKQLSKNLNQKVDGFIEEFERLQYLDLKQGGYSKKEGERPENKTKNRYKNILPYDHSRVKILDVDSKVVGSDYINANYIDSELQESKTTYIAAQGCLPQTIEAFWTMIYQEDCRIVAMLTNEVERGKAKCAKYWPSVGLSVEIGEFVLDNLLEHDKDFYTVRELRLYSKYQDGKEPPRMIYHYHFKKWPDHGAPDSPDSVLDLLDDIYAQHLRCNKKGPLLFHCSAGIGRTGTVIVIDVLIHLLEEQGLDSDIDIQKTTQLLRTKRPGMIQTQWKLLWSSDITKPDALESLCYSCVSYVIPKFQYKFVFKALETHINRLLESNETALNQAAPPLEVYENVAQMSISQSDRSCMPRRQVPRPVSSGNANVIGVGGDKSKPTKPKRQEATNASDKKARIAKRGSLITHVKIQNNGEKFDLYGGETFMSLTELVQFYMENELKERNGEVIQLKYPMNSQDPTNERWYHGLISGGDAERLLLDRGKNGCFLVRESIRSPGDYVLSIRTDENVVHIMIRNIDGCYDAGGGPTFNDLSELVENYKKNPMVEKAGGNVVHLKSPFNATRVTASKISDRVKELMKENTILEGKSGFWEEFEQLQRQEDRHMYTKHEGQKRENKAKNRYRRILPFDHTRVKLKDVNPDVLGSDYINADFIDGDSEVKYIATQGSLPDTIDDFWRMIYFEHCRIILNVTREVERGRTKCAKYWPDALETLETENFSIKGINEKETPEYVLRDFEVTYKSKPDDVCKRVSQYHYVHWPEHGVPPDPGSVLEVLHDVCLCNKNEGKGPIVVHCSAGVGRTGTFIVIDILLGILQTHGLDSEIDIPKTIQLVRSQRPSMVQTEPSDFGIGPPSPMHVSVSRKSNTTEFFGGDDRHEIALELPPPVPERKPRSQVMTSAPVQKPSDPGEVRNKPPPPIPPPIPSKDAPPPIPSRNAFSN
eukprot:gene14900-16444_t